MEEQRLAQQRVVAAERLRSVEAEVSDRAAEVSDLAARRTAAEVRLRQHATALAPLLPLMQRLSLYPAETLLAVPAPPERALTGLGILHGLTAILERDAARLRVEQSELDARARALNEALPRLRAAQAQQAEQAEVLDQQLATAHALQITLLQQGERAGMEAQQRAATDAGRTESLRAVVGTLEAARVRAEAQAREDVARAERQRQDQAAEEARRREAALARPAGPGPEPSGQLLAPVAGHVVRAWGEATEAGPATGVSYRAAPQARVVSPCGGRVRFAGPFRSFGALAILDCGGGYAFVLAGLERLDVAVGAAVLAGEPLGTMPGWDPAGSAGRPALYLELRHDGQAVNPAPFLRAKPGPS